MSLDDDLRHLVKGELDKFYYGSNDAPGGNRLDPYLVDWGELFATEVQETDWLVEPLIARGRGHALYAGAKTGKSLLVLEIAAALATGRPILARAIAARLRVLYLDYEMTMADLRERLEVFGYGPDDDLSDLFYALLPSIPPLDTEAGGRVILEAAKRLAVDLVVIDTTARAVQGDENDADTYRALYRHCGQLLKEAGIAFIRLDHAGKDVEKGQRGSSAKNDDVDVVWQMMRRDEATFKLTATHRRMSWVPVEVEIQQVETDGVMTHLLVETATMPEGTTRIMSRLDDLDAPVDISKRAAREMLKNAGDKCTEAVLLRALKERKKGLVPRVNQMIEQLIGTNSYQKSNGAGHSVVPSAVPARTGSQSSGTGVYVPIGRTAVPDHDPGDEEHLI